MANTGEHPTVPSESRQYDFAKTVISILIALIMLLGGGWLTLLNARVADVDHKVDAVAAAVVDAKATAIDARGKAEVSAKAIEDVDKRLARIEDKIDALSKRR